jgi:hypothetical protein
MRQRTNRKLIDPQIRVQVIFCSSRMHSAKLFSYGASRWFGGSGGGHR